MDAVAYLRGADVHFASGEYKPKTERGQRVRVLGHELAHMIQQRTGRVVAPEGSGLPINADPALESDPELASAHYNAARLYSRTGDVAACLKHLDRVLEIAPQLAEDAANDEHLGWALEMKNLRRDMESEDGSQEEN